MAQICFMPFAAHSTVRAISLRMMGDRDTWRLAIWRVQDGSFRLEFGNEIQSRTPLGGFGPAPH